MQLLQWLNAAKGSPSFLPSYFRIKPENTDQPTLGANPFESNKQYFEVVINEMYLTYKRKWLTNFDPVVFVVTNFEYGGTGQSLPFVVGPDMIANSSKKLPQGQGFLIRNTKVAGMHPIKGNAMGLILILARLPVGNPLKNVLDVVEDIAKTYTNWFEPLIGGYLKVGQVVLNAFDKLTNSNDVKAIIGMSDRYAHEDLRPGYFALINEDGNKFDSNKFYVKGKQLHYGDTMDSAQPFRTDDYVLYSLNKISTREDIETLPIFGRWKKINESIGQIFRKLTEEEKRLYRSQLLQLGVDMKFSPDLTVPQVELLKTQYKAELEKEIADRDLLHGNEVAVKAVKDDWKASVQDLILELNQ